MSGVWFLSTADKNDTFAGVNECDGKRYNVHKCFTYRRCEDKGNKFQTILGVCRSDEIVMACL